jgi:hypothetical protein
MGSGDGLRRARRIAVEATPEPNPGTPELNLDQAWRYLWSYRRLRTLVGAVGIALPFVLVFVDMLAFGEPLRDSLSAYYYSGLRDVFVGALCATAAFLITYKVVEPGPDNWFSNAAGVAALVVALFPKRRIDPNGPLTPLQELVGEDAAATLHFTAGVTFIVALAVISYFFGRRVVIDPARTPAARAVLSRLHFACAAIIGLALAGYALTKLTGAFQTYALLVTEWVAVVAFGISWFASGPRFGASAAATPQSGVTSPD